MNYNKQIKINILRIKYVMISLYLLNFSCYLILCFIFTTTFYVSV